MIANIYQMIWPFVTVSAAMKLGFNFSHSWKDAWILSSQFIWILNIDITICSYLYHRDDEDKEYKYRLTQKSPISVLNSLFWPLTQVFVNNRCCFHEDNFQYFKKYTCIHVQELVDNTSCLWNEQRNFSLILIKL